MEFAFFNGDVQCPWAYSFSAARNMDQPGMGPEMLACVAAAFRRMYAELDERICSEAEARGLPVSL